MQRKISTYPIFAAHASLVAARSRTRARTKTTRSHIMRPSFALVVVLSAVLVASSAPSALAEPALERRLPETTLRALASGDADDIVRAAFIGVDAPGAIVVRDVSATYAAARRRGLRALANCASSASSSASTSAFARSSAWSVEHDGATRATIAAKTSERLRFSIDSECGDGGAVRGDLEIMREGADVVGRATLRRLDAAFHNATRGFYERSAASDASLDHFHAYGVSGTKSRAHDEGASAEEVTVAKEDAHGKHAHTDVGVAIIMTPALLAGEEPGARGSRGLFIGDIEPDVPDDGLIVMLGEAARAWAPGLSEEMRALLKVPTHAMKLVGERAWFGRMVLPETSTTHPMREHAGLTFGTWHDGAIHAAIRSRENNRDDDDDKWASAACAAPKISAHAFDSSPVSSKRRRILADDNSCDAGYIYCWLSCLEAPSECSSTAQCIDQTSGAEWTGDDDGHCSACAATCPATSSTTRTGYCNTDIPPTTMFMDGFSLNGGGSNAPCVALLFKSWSLHTPALMALGFLATFIMGASIEALASVRRKLQSPGFCNCHNIAPPKSRAYCVALYSMQVTIGYLLMLVSMTYHFVLFSAVILGLVFGHVAFGAAAPVTATTTACCAFASPSDKQDCAGCAPDANGARASCCAAGAPPSPSRDDVDVSGLAPCCAARVLAERATSSSDASDASDPSARSSPTGGSQSSAGGDLEKPLYDVERAVRARR